MPAIWFVFLSAWPLPILSEDNFPFWWEANLWKGGEEKTRRTGGYWQKCCLRENAGSDLLPVIIMRKRKSIQSWGKSNVARLCVCFSVNSQTFHLWYFTRGCSHLDAAWLPTLSLEGVSQSWRCQDLGLARGRRGARRQRGSHFALLTPINYFIKGIYKIKRFCKKETAIEIRWFKPQENSWDGQENCG